MTAATYALAAAIVALLALNLRRQDPHPRGYQDFLGLAITLALTWLGFALSLLPRLDALRAIGTITMPMAAAFAWRCFDLRFSPKPIYTRWHRSLLVLCTAVGLVAACMHAMNYGPIPRSSPPEVIAGITTFSVGLLGITTLWRAYRASTVTSEATRIRWLIGTTSAGILLAVAEWVARTSQPIPDERALRFFERGLALQGMIPPVSPLLMTLSVYFVYHALRAHRIVALQARFARILVSIAAAALLLTAHSLALAFVALTRFPLHSGFLLFLLSAMGLYLFSTAVRPALHWTRHRILGPGRALEDASTILARVLSASCDPLTLCREVADVLFATERFDAIAVWSQDLHAQSYLCHAQRGAWGDEPLPQPPSATFLTRDERWFTAPSGHIDWIAMRIDHTTMGWISLRDAPWSDGFTSDEREDILRVAQGAAELLASFERLNLDAEAQRLAALGTMSAGLAHEIRNPLAGIKGAAQLLQSEMSIAEQQEVTEIIVAESDRLDRVVHDFLDFARPLDLHAATHNVLATLKHVLAITCADPHNAKVDIDISLVDPDMRFCFDDDKLTAVLLNLVRNSVEAMDHRGTVSIKAQGLDAQLIITIRDQGPGFPTDILDRPFTPFLTTKVAGTGLGLALSHRLIALHRGTLRLRNADDIGAIVMISLPQPA